MANGEPTSATNLDCLIIGAGFGGCYQLRLLREAGYNVQVVDAASSIGGVWAWNRYPGARVDVEMPYYGYSDPKIWTTWNWSERFPARDELLRYFEHVDRIWDLSKDITLNVRIVSASWNKDDHQWQVSTSAGHVYNAKFLVCGTGTSFKQYIPTFEGVEKFKGVLHHSSLWPEGVDLKDKRVAVIGAGSTGVQVIQEAAKVSSKVTQFIRTPNLALPMRQRQVSREEIYTYKPVLHHAIKALRTSPTGLPIQNTGKKVFDVDNKERHEIFEELWEKGGFNWGVGGFTDTMLNKESNRAIYDFWAHKQRQRMRPGKKRDLLIPLEPPYYMGTKRPSLEQDYYEMCDRDNVDVTALPIVRFTEKGIATEEKEEEFDIVVVCTGYDAVTGGLMTMNIRGEDGEYLHDRWQDGVVTFLGLMVNGFPNMFMLYGPQAPTSLTNGPPFLELEGEWVRDVMTRLRDENKSIIDAKKEKAEAWRETVLGIAGQTLAVHTNSWYMGANVPGKRREYLLYMGGMQNWHQACQEALEGWAGFVVR